MDKNKSYSAKDFANDSEISTNFDFSTSIPIHPALGAIISVTGVSSVPVNTGGIPTVTNFLYGTKKKASVKDNIIEALTYKENHSREETLIWFYNKVRNGGEWDYKQLDKSERIEFKKKYGIDVPSQYEDFGNYNYGAVAKALGLSEEITKAAAGYAQGVSETGSSTIAVLRMIKDRYNGGDNSYGDAIEDQEMIKKGINAVKAYIAENDSSMDDAVEDMAIKKFLKMPTREIFDGDGLSEMPDSLMNFIKIVAIHGTLNHLRDKTPNQNINDDDLVNISDFDPPLWHGTAEGLGTALKSLWDAIKTGPPTSSTTNLNNADYSGSPAAGFVALAIAEALQ